MPIYEYQCRDCGKVEEVFQKVSDPACTTCSQCEGTLDKLISQSSFHLKGSGWYVTDYGGSKKGADNKPESKKESSAASEPKKTEAKAAD